MPAPVPHELAPMLAVDGPVPAQGTWSYEVKWDGHRALARVVAGRVELRSRRGHDITGKVAGIDGLGATLAGTDCLLDGELVAFDASGRPDFSLLGQRLGAPAGSGPPVTYLIFDVLHVDGASWLDVPHARRRQRLDAMRLTGGVWATPPLLHGDPAAVLAAVTEQGLEGLLAKEVSSPYRPGVRSDEWRKLVVLHRAEVVVGGWQPGAGRRAGSVGSLLLGIPDDGPAGRLRYVGHVGTGFTDHTLAQIHARLQPLARRSSPFSTGIPRGRERSARWVAPELEAEVEFHTWTADGILRQARWRGWRDGG